MDIIPIFQIDFTFFVFIALCVFLCIQFFYVTFIHLRLAIYSEQKSKKTEEKPPVSIVIAARNEADNLYQFLPKILEQKYPTFEVLVVNHQSIDDSYNILNALLLQYPDKLKVVEVERSKHLGTGKKFPLSLGIKASKYDYLVLTDADCEPTSDLWLSKMMSKFTQGKDIVLGYAPYRKEKGLLNSIIRFDTAMIGMNYLAFALSRIPFMGVGRNLAYTKKLFQSVNGFKSHYSIISGDDDLFIQETAKKKNYCIQIDEGAFCLSKGKDTFYNWTIQKSRHYTTSHKYQVIKKLLLGIYPFSLIFAFICFVILLFNFEYRILASIVFAFVVLIKWWIQGVCLAKLKAKKFILFFPILDLFYAILIPAMYYMSDKNNKSKWK